MRKESRLTCVLAAFQEMSCHIDERIGCPFAMLHAAPCLEGLEEGTCRPSPVIFLLEGKE